MVTRITARVQSALRQSEQQCRDLAVL